MDPSLVRDLLNYLSLDLRRQNKVTFTFIRKVRLLNVPLKPESTL